MKYYLLIPLLMIVGCADLVTNNAASREFTADILDEQKKDDDIAFKGIRPTLHYAPVVTKNIYADSAKEVQVGSDHGEPEVERLQEILKELDAVKIQAFHERDIAIEARLQTETKLEAKIHESEKRESKSGLYLILVGGGCLLLVGALSLLLIVLKYQLGIRTKALGSGINNLTSLKTKSKKWGARHKTGLKSIADQIRLMESDLGKNGLTTEERHRLNQFKNYLRDLRDVLLGRLLHEEEE